MSDYSYTEIMKMQEEAIKRVDEMRKRADEAANAYNKTSSGSQNAAPVKENAPARVPMPNTYLDTLKSYGENSSYGVFNSETESTSKQKRGFTGSADNIKSILNNINVDSDTALVLSLVLLLSDEGADEKIILALLYILT